MEERADKMPMDAQQVLTEAVQRLVDLYTAWDKLDEAAKWKQKLEEHQAAAKAAR